MHTYVTSSDFLYGLNQLLTEKPPPDPPTVQGPRSFPHRRPLALGFLVQGPWEMSSLDPSSSGLFPIKKNMPSKCGNVCTLGKKRNVFVFTKSYWPNHWTRILSKLQHKHRLYQLVFVSLRGPQWMQRLKTCTAFYGRWWFRSDIGHECFHGEMWVE